MPENIKALFVVLGMAMFVFVFVRQPATESAPSPGDFTRRRNLWIGITLVAFLAHNYWIFIAVSAVMLFVSLNKEPNKLAAFYLLLFVVPQISGTVPGFGLVEFLFKIDFVRLLALVVLLPAYLSLRAKPGTAPFGRYLPDKLMMGYAVLQFVLMFQATTVTDVIRRGIFYAFLDGFLPYYVASRLPTSLKNFRDAMAAFTVAAQILAVIAMFEYVKHWLLYNSLATVLDGVDGWGWGYLARGESLRATASAGQPIPLGYVITIAIGFTFYLQNVASNPTVWRRGLAILIGGLIATISRGPWIGAIALLLAYIATGPTPAKGFVKLSLLGALLVPIVLASPLGKKIIDLIPFVGTVEPQNAEYRQLFVQQSLLVIKNHPWLGVYDFLHAQEMAQLVTQWGGIDTLNVFITVALGSGLIGLSLYGGFFVAVVFNVFRRMRSISDKSDERYQLGRALLCTLVGMAVILNSISAILIIPLLYWSIGGLGVAYANMALQSEEPQKAGRARAPRVRLAT